MEQIDNEALALWAGFKLVGVDTSLGYTYSTKDGIGRLWIWLYPDGSKHSELPNFTDPEWGIAYCFKWLVPKLKEMHLDIAIDIDSNSIHPTFVEIIPAYGNPNVGCAESDEEEPALALCLAIEKLIDSEASDARNR